MKRQILIVEDDEIVRETLVEGLCDDYQVEGVKDGFEAMVSIWKRRPDLVITDLNMFDLDGISLVKNIISNPANKKIKFILISGYLNKEHIDQWKALMAEPVFFAKPFTLTEIKHAVKKMLGSECTQKI